MPALVHLYILGRPGTLGPSVDAGAGRTALPFIKCCWLLAGHGHGRDHCSDPPLPLLSTGNTACCVPGVRGPVIAGDLWKFIWMYGSQRHLLLGGGGFVCEHKALYICICLTSGTKQKLRGWKCSWSCDGRPFTGPLQGLLGQMVFICSAQHVSFREEQGHQSSELWAPFLWGEIAPSSAPVVILSRQVGKYRTCGLLLSLLLLLRRLFCQDLACLNQPGILEPCLLQAEGGLLGRGLAWIQTSVWTDSQVSPGLIPADFPCGFHFTLWIGTKKFSLLDVFRFCFEFCWKANTNMI